MSNFFIKISELDVFPTASDAIKTEDFFPIVDSGSLTTYRASLQAIGSLMTHSIFADSASVWTNYVPPVSCSWASASYFSSVALSASWASSSVSSSHASTASFACTASFAITTSYAFAALSASFAPFTQLSQLSSSWASQSLSASYAITASYVANIVDSLPIGTIMAFASQTVPNNWLECDGTARLTSSFQALYNTIQTGSSAAYGFLCDSFGNANPAGAYFKLPDLRGEFLRGWDHSRGVDTGRAFATFESNSIQAHTHSVNIFGFNPNRASPVGTALSSDGTAGEGNISFGTTTNNNGGAETRPRNVSVMYCIKYSNATNLALSGQTIAGDVVGNLTASQVVGLQGIPVNSAAPTQGEILVYNGGNWNPQPPQFFSFIKAFGTFYFTGSLVLGSLACNFVPFSGSYNFITGTYIGPVYQTSGSTGMTTNSLMPVGPNQGQYGNLVSWIFNMTTPLPSTNYTVIAVCGGEQGSETITGINFPYANRTTTAFTLSLQGSANFDARGTETDWLSVMVLHP